MRKIFRMLIILFCLVIFNGVSSAQSTTDEKQLIIKGISLGMDINEARTKMVNLLGKDWKVSPVGKTEDILADYRSGDTNIFLDNFAQRDPKRRTDISDFKLPGGWGFAIQGKNNYYSGYISADKSSNKVTRISFNGKITDHIFSASNTEVHDFVEQFRTYYNLPDFNWIVGGWTYASPNGYALTIRKDKFLDIVLTKLDKKDEIKGSDDKLKFN